MTQTKHQRLLFWITAACTILEQVINEIDAGLLFDANEIRSIKRA